MSCRSTGAGSAFTSWARISTGNSLSDQATLSTFHHLRAVYAARPASRQRQYTRAEYRALLNETADRINRDTRLTDAQRTRLLDRISRARREPVPDHGLVYALTRIVPEARARARALDGYLVSIAEQTGEPVATVRARFATLAEGRTSRNTPEVTADTVRQVTELGLAGDAGTVYAAMHLRDDAAPREQATNRRVPRRIGPDDWTELPSRLRSTGISGITVQAYAYDPRNERLEVRVRDARTREVTEHAYREVRDFQARWLGERGGEYWAEHIRANQWIQYSSAQAAARAGRAPRCEYCGQWASVSHSCPMTRQPITVNRWSYGERAWTDSRAPFARVDSEGQVHTGTVAVEMPSRRRLAELASEHRVFLNTSADADGMYSRGTIIIARDYDGSYLVDMSDWSCNCDEFYEGDDRTCVHFAAVEQAVMFRLDPSRQPAADAYAEQVRQQAVERAARIVNELAAQARASDWANDPMGSAEAAATWRQDSDILYSEDPNAFLRDMRAGQRAAKRGNANPVPYMRENALDGMAQRGSGVAFGVEIEYEFPENWSSRRIMQAQDRIGKELFEAGLTYSRIQQRYGSSQDRGYRDTHTEEDGTGTWSWEQDGSVSGELVTPGMYDEPETWQKLETALDILRRNGAVAGVEAGAHVHVSTGQYTDGRRRNSGVRAYAELARMVTQHEDVLVRLGSSPFRGTHRDNGYSNPLPTVPPAGFRSVSAARDWQHHTGPGRYATLNLENCGGIRSDHAEFRVFDATLNPGALQAQIKVAVATVYAAQRNAEAGGTTRPAEPWGAHARRNLTETNPDLAADSASTRSFLDTLFRRREDKAQLAAVFGLTKWTTHAETHERW